VITAGTVRRLAEVHGNIDNRMLAFS